MEGHGYRTRTMPTTASPSTPHFPADLGSEADLGNAARLRLNIDARLMPVERRASENLRVWYRPPARSRSAPRVPLADAIVADLGLACDATAVTLRLDGYAVSSADVLRDGDVLHVCARNDGGLDGAHGGPWPVSPAAASAGVRVRGPATAPPGARPYARLAAGEEIAGGSETSEDEVSREIERRGHAKRQRFGGSGTPETAIADRHVPERATARSAPPERSRSARRKALKRARKRAASFGAAEGNADAPNAGEREEIARALPAPPGRHERCPVCDWLFKGAQGIPAHYKKHITQGRSQEEKEAAQAAWDEHKAYIRAKNAPETRAGMRNGTRALGPKPRERLVPASFLPANAALDPNGDLASHGGTLAGWPEHEWVPHPSESVLRAAESSLAARQKPEKNVAPPPPSSRTTVRRNARKVFFDDRASTSSSSSSSDTASDSGDSDFGGSEEKRENARTDRTNSDSASDANAPPPAKKRNPDPPRSDDGVSRVTCRAGRVTRTRLESLVAADHTLANQATSVPGSVDPDDVGAALLPGDVVRYRYRTPPEARANRAYAFECSYFQGEVVSVEPDFGDGGGVRLAVTIAPWPERRRTEALVCAARAAAEAQTRSTPASDAAPFPARLPAPFDETCVAKVGTRDVLEAVLVGGPRHVAAERAETNVGVFSNVLRGVGGALVALRAVGSFE